MQYFLTLICWFIFGFQLSAQLSFRHLAESAESSVNVGDVNQDGIVDIFCSSAETMSFGLGSYDLDGHLQFTFVPSEIFLSSVYFTNVRTADWDNDGDIDIIPRIHYVSEYHSVLTENFGDRFADTALFFTSPYPSLQHIDFVDFNKDSYIDAFYPTNSKTIIRCGMTGDVYELPLFPKPGSGSVRFIDIDRDGWLDGIQMNTAGGVTGIYFFKGSANFAFEDARLITQAPGYSITHFGDYDGDGQEDMVVRPPFGVNNLLIFTKIMSGDPLISIVEVPVATTIFYYDIDSDGLDDLIFTRADSFHLLRNLGSGQFDTYHFPKKYLEGTVPRSSLGPFGVHNDFIVMNFGLAIRYNFHFENGSFSVTSSEDVIKNAVLNPNNYTVSCMADLDGDGNKEVIAGIWNSRGISRFEVFDSSNFQSRILFADITGPAITAIAAGDFDLDQKDEVVFFDRAGGVYIGGLNDEGIFEVGPPLLLDIKYRNIFDIVVADFDGNGFPDFIFNSGGIRSIQVFSNLNGRDFELLPLLDNIDILNARAKDIDNDGLDDLIISAFPYPGFKSGTYIFKNEGDFNFSELDYFGGSLGLSASEGVFGDLVPLYNGEQFFITRVTSSGFLTENSFYLPSSSNEFAMVDYNQDSLPDIYYKPTSGRNSYICLNRGDGTFEMDAVILPFVTVNNVVDADHDGFPEMLMIHKQDWKLAYFGNSGMTGIHLTDIQSSMKVFPSPAKTEIYLESEKEKYDSWLIYNSAGCLSKKGTFLKGQSIFVGDLSSGIYFIIARGTDGIESLGRFVIGN